MNQSDPKVSVVIPNYNGRKIIKECVEAILRSDYSNLEIIIVDNGSTDGSYEYLKTVYAHNPKIRVVRSDQQLFFTGGCNLGARKAQGDTLVFLNSDTTVDENWIGELIKFGQTHRKCIIQPKVLNYFQREIIDTAGGIYSFFGIGQSRGHGEKDIGQYDKNEQMDYASGTCFMIGKKFFEELGGFDEWYKYHYEDVDLNLRARKFGGESWYCYKSVIYHKGSLTFKGNVRDETLLFNIRKNRLRTVIKNFAGLERIVRVSGLLLIYTFLALQDLLTFRPQRMFLTVKSVFGVLDQEYKLLIEKTRLWELKSFVKKDSFSLLDLGCGDGSFLDLACQKGVEVLGVDKAPSTHPQILASTIEGLELNKKFDVLTIFHVLEHVKNPKEVLKKAVSFLKKDGVLVIEVPLIGNLTEKFLQKDYFAYHDQTHLNFFTKRELFKLLDEAGLEIKKKGNTLLEFPFTVLTTSFRMGILSGFLGIVLFVPLKILSVLGFNDEIIQVYCVKTDQ